MYEEFLNKDGTINRRKVRRSIGSRRSRKEGTKRYSQRKPEARNVKAEKGRVRVERKMREIEKALSEKPAN